LNRYGAVTRSLVTNPQTDLPCAAGPYRHRLLVAVVLHTE